MKTALIGLGRIGWDFHLHELLLHEIYGLCAVVDPSQERLDEAKDKYGLMGFADHRQMLEQVQPDLVVIASPTLFHEEQAIAAMEAGADVLLDKPMTMDLASARRVAQVQQKTGRKLVVFQPRRFDPDTLAVKALLASGKLGQIYRLRANSYNYSRRDDWQSLRKFGGGMRINYGAHYVDQLIYLSNSNVTNLYCQMRRVISAGDAEDVVHILMETENGMLLDVDINQATPLSAGTLVVFGSLGSAEIRTGSDGNQYLFAKYCDPAKLADKKVSRDMAAPGRKYPSDKIDWITEEIPLSQYPWQNFYDLCQPYFVQDGTSPVPLEQTLRVMELLEQCRIDAD